MEVENIILECVNCNSELKRYLQAWLYRCEKCGLYKSLLHDEKYNGLNPIGWTESATDFLGELRKENAERILNELSKHLQLDNKRLLDIGCAAGWFLQTAEQYKMVATGLEPEKDVASRGIDKGLDIKISSFPSPVLDGNKFDVITFNDVFEHIEKPNEILKQVYGTA